MSGGNQQKAIVAREISRDTDLLIAVQPTRGLDIGAIEYIHQQLIRQRDMGKAVLLVSLELDEVLNVADRIVVMYEGAHMGEFDAATVDEAQLGVAMAGGQR
jgi:simple sugar transport system ATP-binding protein